MTSSLECKNFLRSLQLLNHFVVLGARYFILCPGSRSAPLALAAGELLRLGRIKLFNSIDERSAAFHALGLSAASGEISVVITTSGTAVANLLPAAIEADRSCNSILFLTADRPFRLKDCGANQTINQEDFLLPVCEKKFNTNLNGLHLNDDLEMMKLIKSISEILFTSSGPIHLNIPIEQPLMISKENKKRTFELFQKLYLPNRKEIIKEHNNKKSKSKNIAREFEKFDLLKRGIIIVGPYEGSSKDLLNFNNALKEIQDLTGWAIFADPISGINNEIRGLIKNWELILSNKNYLIECDQLLRLGRMSSSKYLEEFLINFEGNQFLIKENNVRNLDPTKKAIEYEFGLDQFVNSFVRKKDNQNLRIRPLSPLANQLITEGERIHQIFSKQLDISYKITEIALAHYVPKFWPKDYPIMLSASSPIRDWLTFAENKPLSRRCFSFRGASGIDGTLSLALGIARVNNPLLLVTGDLTFLHDINGLLIENSSELKLTILLIDNNGGNIFNRLYKNDLSVEEIEKLFVMPRFMNWQKLAETYKLPYRDVLSLNKLKDALDWSLSMQKSTIIKVSIDVDYEINLKKSILKNIYFDENI